MSKIAQLRELRNQLARQAQELNAKFPADQRMPQAEAQKLDEVLAQVEACDADIAREERANKLLADSRDPLDTARERHTRTPAAHTEGASAVRSYLLGGINALSQEQRQALEARLNPDIRASMSTQQAAEGGFTVATEYMRELDRALKEFGGMLEAATVMNTATGAVMNFPTSNATGEEGEIIGENTEVSRQDTVFGNVQLSVYKYSSKDIALPFELLQDSFVDIEAVVQEILAERLGRIWNRHATVGTGVGQPRGIVTAASAGVIAANGQTSSVSYDDLVELEHSIDPAYRRSSNVAFMFHDQTLKVIRKIKDSNQRPIFVPGYETTVPGGAPDRLLNRPFIINQNMPTMAANAKSILFGVLSKYRIRRVMDLTMFRMTDSAFTRRGQIGMLAFQRAGGNLVDADGSTVKYFQNSAA